MQPVVRVVIRGDDFEALRRFYQEALG